MGCFLSDITVGFVLTEDTIPESQGYVEVCTRLNNVVPSGMDLNLTVSLGFSQGKPSTECEWEQTQLSKGGYTAHLCVWLNAVKQCIVHDVIMRCSCRKPFGRC